MMFGNVNKFDKDLVDPVENPTFLTQSTILDKRVFTTKEKEHSLKVVLVKAGVDLQMMML